MIYNPRRYYYSLYPGLKIVYQLDELTDSLTVSLLTTHDYNLRNRLKSVGHAVRHGPNTGSVVVNISPSHHFPWVQVRTWVRIPSSVYFAS